MSEKKMTWERDPKTGLTEQGCARYLSSSVFFSDAGSGLDVEENYSPRYIIERLGPTRWKLLAWDEGIRDGQSNQTGGYRRVNYAHGDDIFPRLGKAQETAEKMERRRGREF